MTRENLLTADAIGRTLCLEITMHNAESKAARIRIADVEPLKPTEAEEAAEDYRGEVRRQIAAVEDWAAKRAAENAQSKEKVATARGLGPERP